MNKLMQTVTENVAYVVIFLAVIVGCFLVAVVLEKGAQKKNGISEPIFNTRKLAMIGMFSAIAMIIWMMAKGSIDSISDEYGILDICGTAVIVIGVVLLAFVEQKISKEEQPESDRKYTRGALALIFPLLYCIFDTIGTAADGIILDGEHGLGLGEIDVLVLYGITFLLVGIGCWIFLLIREHKPYNPFARHELWKGAAASAEQFGQIFYVFAMSRNPVLAAPMIASYCIVSVILSRVFLGEKLRRNQAICVALVIIGIVALGISEGLGEM